MKAPKRALRVGPYEIDLQAEELRRHGLPVKLQDKPFQVLRALLAKPGELIRREELHRELWPGDTFVDFDNNLNTAVAKLRDALNDSAENPRYIQTVPRRGYRFVARVEEEVEMPQAATGSVGLPVKQARARRSRIRTLVPVAVLAVVATSLQFVHTPASRAPKIMLAVLPFENLSGDLDQEYFSDGLTEEMITHLGRLQPKRLGVIARTSAMSYKKTQKSVAQIGEELDVNYVLEGSVRRAGNRIRVSAQLIQVSDQTHLWAETYERDLADIFRIESELVARIARSLTLRLLPDDPSLLARASTTNTAAFEAYLRGRHEWNKFTPDGFQASLRHFRRAIELDPNYALAYAGLADAYNFASPANFSPSELLNKAEQAARQALQLDPNLEEAHRALGYTLFSYAWNFDAALQRLERALELNPGSAVAHHWYSRVLSALGRHDEALAAVRRALELDPNSPGVRSDLGWYLLFADRYDQAIEACREMLQRMPDSGAARSCLVEAYAQKGQYQDAVAMLRELLSQAEVSRQQIASLRDPDPAVEYRNIFQFGLEWSLRNAKRQPAGAASGIAMLYARLGRNDQAFEWLEKAYQERNGWLVFLNVDPRFDSLHGDPRFHALARRIGLPQA